MIDKNKNEERQLRRHIKFTIWNTLRNIYHKGRGVKIGQGVFIDKNVSLLRFPKNIEIGNGAVLKQGSNICACNKEARISIGSNTTIGFYTFIYASESIEIGQNCLLAPFVYIVDSDHSIELGKLINSQPNQVSGNDSSDDVWIATGDNILTGVKIGREAVIAAGEVVKDDVPPYTIIAGIPAKKIGERRSRESLYCADIVQLDYLARF